MTIQSYKQKILQILHEKHAIDSLQALDCEDLAQQIGVAWDNMRHEVSYLAEKEYVVLKSRQIRTRLFHTIYITVKGIDLLQSSVTEGWGERHTEMKSSKLIKILFLAANPLGTPALRLDEEIREIDLALRQSRFRDRYDIKQHWAVRVSDLQGYLLRHQPDIVHFSGHGSATNEIILEDNRGNSKPVSPKSLKRLFSILKDNVRCVILNACYSENQAQAIAESIDSVIGMSKAISDRAAIAFASSFYQALGYGRDIHTAFELGNLQIELEDIDEEDTPKLIAKNIDPRNIVFVLEDKFQ